MSHRALLVVVRGKRALAYVDRWLGARVLDVVLDGGPTAVDELAHSLTAIGDIGADHAWEAGVLGDPRRKRVLWFGDPTTRYVGEELGEAPTDPDAFDRRIAERWSGWDVEPVDGAGDFRAHLARQRTSVEQVRVEATPPPPEPGDPECEARFAALRAAEDALASDPRDPGAPHAPARAGCSTTLALVVFVFAPALLVRLLTWPLRRPLRAWVGRREAGRARAAARVKAEAVARLDAQVAAAPDAAAARIDRALLREPLRAEHELSEVVALLEGREHDDEQRRLLAIALHNRGAMRRALRLGRLADADLARARALGFVQRRRSPFTAVRLGWGLFVVVAGLHAGEDSASD